MVTGKLVKIVNILKSFDKECGLFPCIMHNTFDLNIHALIIYIKHHYRRQESVKKTLINIVAHTNKPLQAFHESLEIINDTLHPGDNLLC